MSAVAESIEDVLISSSATYRVRLVERPVNYCTPTCFELDTRQAGVDSYQLTLELSKMRSSTAGISNPVIEKVAGTASANVDTIVLGQAEIEDFGVRLSLNGTRMRHPISATCCLLKGCVTATYSWTGTIEFRKNPSLEVKALVANTNDFALIECPVLFPGTHVGDKRGPSPNR